MNGETKMQTPRKQIDGLLNGIQVDLDSVQKTILEIKRSLLGLEVPTPEEKTKEPHVPKGWLNRIIRMLNGFGTELRQIHQFEREVLNAIVEHPELKETAEQLRTEMKETIP